jgi:hypothetical protein
MHIINVQSFFCGQEVLKHITGRAAFSGMGVQRTRLRRFSRIAVGFWGDGYGT